MYSVCVVFLLLDTVDLPEKHKTLFILFVSLHFLALLLIISFFTVTIIVYLFSISLRSFFLLNQLLISLSLSLSLSLYIYIYIYILVMSNDYIQNKSFCLHNKYTQNTHIYYVCINTHT